MKSNFILPYSQLLFFLISFFLLYGVNLSKCKKEKEEIPQPSNERSLFCPQEKIIPTFLIGGGNSIAQFAICLNAFNIISKSNAAFKILDTFSFAVLGIVILGIKLYRHHIFSLAIIGISIILVTLYFYKDFIKEREIGNIVSSCLNPFLGILTKYLINQRNMHPLIIIGYIGMIGFIGICLLFIIGSFTSEDNIWRVLKNFYSQAFLNWDSIQFLGIYSIEVASSVVYAYILYYLPPSFIPMCFCISAFVNSFISDHEVFNWYTIVGLVLYCLGIIIYNEIIILNFWGGGDNTGDGIAKKENIDTEGLNIEEILTHSEEESRD